MREYISTLEFELINYSNASIAVEQKAYMRNQFEFYGLKTTDRRKILKPFLSKQHLPEKTELVRIVEELWQRPEREYQYFSQELAFLYQKKLELRDIDLFEFMVLHKSWWDTVDFIATKLIGEYFKKFPEQKEKYVMKWLRSDNIWLQRTTLLFQLKYKKELDELLLSSIINNLLNSNEFFINKAIGWILREHGKFNPKWVINFANNTKLQPLSRKEALRLLNK